MLFEAPNYYEQQQMYWGHSSKSMYKMCIFAYT